MAAAFDAAAGAFDHLGVSTVYSIGHSNHAFARLAELLRQHRIGRLVDVRSQPHSRRFPQFNRRALDAALASVGIEYRFLGDALGGRPRDAACYAADGSVDYERRAGSADFLDALERLAALAEERPTAMLCAEEDPQRCHRRLLIAPALLAHGLRVVHIRGDGRLEDEHAGGAQLGLFSR